MAEKETPITTYEIVKALAQAASVYDGSTDKEGKPLKIGLTREQGNPILDKRAVDGFKVKISGKYMILLYHAECLLQDIHKMGIEKYENEIEGHVKDIIDFIKKDYKNYAKGDLKLTQEGEIETLVEPVSRIRTVVRSIAKFKIGNLEDLDNVPQLKKMI